MVARPRRLKLSPEPNAVERGVTEQVDLADARERAHLDLYGDVDPVVVELDNLRLNGRRHLHRHRLPDPARDARRQ
jgi:hypothetical protein